MNDPAVPVSKISMPATDSFFRRYLREISVLAAYLGLLLLLAIKAPHFYQSNEFKSILVNNSSVLVLAIGMSLVIICRHIDISIGSIMSICGIVAGLCAKNGMPMPLVAIVSILVGVALGSVNGFFVAIMGLPSIVVTLAMMVILQESLRWWRNGAFVLDLPTKFQWLGLAQDTGQWVIVGMAMLVFFVMAWSMMNIAAGRAVYATGSDMEAARLAGIKPKVVTFWVFAFMGAFTGLAAILSIIRFPSVDPKVGLGIEMRVIAAAVVGGIAISGGRGTIIGALIGVALLGTVGPALPFLGSEAYWDRALQGTIILVAVAFDSIYEKLKKRS